MLLARLIISAYPRYQEAIVKGFNELRNRKVYHREKSLL